MGWFLTIGNNLLAGMQFYFPLSFSAAKTSSDDYFLKMKQIGKRLQ